MKAKKTSIPREECTTIRQTLIALLGQHPLSIRELSTAAHIPEKEVVIHLEHIRVAARKGDRRLHLTPAVCLKCGFVFNKRERLTKPGKCPVCRNEQITGPLYGLGP